MQMVVVLQELTILIAIFGILFISASKVLKWQITNKKNTYYKYNSIN